MGHPERTAETSTIPPSLLKEVKKLLEIGAEPWKMNCVRGVWKHLEEQPGDWRITHGTGYLKFFGDESEYSHYRIFNVYPESIGMFKSTREGKSYCFIKSNENMVEFSGVRVPFNSGEAQLVLESLNMAVASLREAHPFEFGK